MAFLGLLSSSPPPLLLSSPPNISNFKTHISNFQPNPISPPLSTFSSLHCSHKWNSRRFFPRAAAATPSSSSSPSSEHVTEPTTKVKFDSSLMLPGCSSPLSLFGTGYREKVFAIIGVKVYAVGLYANVSIVENLNAWKGRPEAEYQEDPSFFYSVYQAPMEKALQIILVRDIDGKTFWNALSDAISPRIQAPTRADDSALSTFQSIFQGRPLNKGTVIFLTWPDPSKMLVSISADGPSSNANATIESTNINYALFDVFFGDAPVSPSLKASVCNRFAEILK